MKSCFSLTQASNSMWSQQEPWLVRVLGPNIGPLLLSICCLTSCATSLLTTRIVDRFGYMALLITHYAMLCILLLCHLYPTIWLLLPAYILLGLTQGPAWTCKLNLVVFYANRITCGQHECNSSMYADPNYCNRTERIRRLARWFHAIQDIGIMLGALIASILITCDASDTDCINTKFIFDDLFGGTAVRSVVGNHSIEPLVNDSMNNLVNGMENSVLIASGGDRLQLEQQPHPLQTIGFNLYELYQNALFRDELLNSMYDTNERGGRICGSDACPAWRFEKVDVNGTDTDVLLLQTSDTMPLTMVYLLFGIVALCFTCISQQVDNTLRFEMKRPVRNTLMWAGPMAYFIGTEQGYVLGDFTRVSDFFFLALFYTHKLTFLIVNNENSTQDFLEIQSRLGHFYSFQLECSTHFNECI